MVAWSSLKDARAITLRGERLASAIIKKVKPLENRDIQLQGWVWIHAGRKETPDIHAEIIDAHTQSCPTDSKLRGHIIGAAHFSKCITLAEAKADPVLKPWAFGPRCSLIDDALELCTAVPARGYLGLWSKDLPRDELEAAFRATTPENLVVKISADAATIKGVPKSEHPPGVDDADCAAIRAALREMNGMRSLRA